MREIGNMYSIKLDGKTIVTKDQKTVDGLHVFGHGKSGTFLTEVGEINVSIPDYGYMVVVSGESLARPVRQNSPRDAFKHREAISGKHTILTGDKYHGAATFGKDHKVEVKGTF